MDINHLTRLNSGRISMTSSLDRLSSRWTDARRDTECSLHQLAPYIGKLKPSMAAALVEQFSGPGDIVFDPFCGSGVIALESVLLGRGVIANDINPYAQVLTRAKLFPYRHVATALRIAHSYVSRAKAIVRDRGYAVDAPHWVRSLFHRRTLAEVKTLADLLLADRKWFLLGNLLGILHHQRPGFLSHPCSHLVPYLRDKNFPPAVYPELYEYRDVGPRLVAKLRRTYRRTSETPTVTRRVFAENVDRFTKRVNADVAITSPPYMNALDYGRDNRLRLWFLGVDDWRPLDELSPGTPTAFFSLMVALRTLLTASLKKHSRAILVVGEVRGKRKTIDTNAIVRRAFEESGEWALATELLDYVPDVRRSRQGCSTTKREWLMVFQKN
jgi:hypothetical protein